VETSSESWRRCSACKNGIPFGADHFVCNVSTCNRPRTGLVFCSVSCWETHVPVMNHRESWAVEKKAPTREAWLREQSAAAGGAAPVKPSAPVPPPTRAPGVMASMPTPRPAESRPAPSAGGREVLVVASKLKAYVKAISDMNTSDGVLEPLSDWLRGLASEAVRNAERDGRRTVLERDIPRRTRS
jgi:hypothetical protein